MEALTNWFNHLRARPEHEEEQQTQVAQREAVIEKVARLIVSRRLEAPATLFLELNRPLGFVYSQTTYFARPFLSLFLSPTDVTAAAEVLDDPKAIDALLDRIGELSAARQEGSPRG
jgi:hypothetical protein